MSFSKIFPTYLTILFLILFILFIYFIKKPLNQVKGFVNVLCLCKEVPNEDGKIVGDEWICPVKIGFYDILDHGSIILRSIGYLVF